LSETSLGIIPAQIAPFVVGRLGAALTRRLGLTGERLDGVAAEAIGLVDQLADDAAGLDELIAEWLTRIGRCGPHANRQFKALVARCGQTPVDSLLAHHISLPSACAPKVQKVSRPSAKSAMRAGSRDSMPASSAPRNRQAPERKETFQRAFHVSFQPTLPYRARGQPGRDRHPHHADGPPTWAWHRCRLLRGRPPQPHVASADRAVCIGAAAPRESYLNIAAIIAAARNAGADAVHPGYGFLAENAEFADAVTEAGLVFVGPPASAIRAMGNKAEAKRLMLAADMPCVPGYQGEAQDDKTLLAEAGRIGFPLMVKAAAGGGGRGMRLVPMPLRCPRRSPVRGRKPRRRSATTN
jgi:hypothetical protein